MIGRIVRFGTPLLVLFGAIGFVMVLFKNPPAPELNTAFSVLPMVRVLEVEAQDIPMVIRGKGTVTPSRKVMLTPQVPGKVIQRHEDLEPGALMEAGSILIEIEPKDYELAVKMQESTVAKAKLALDIERGRKRVAEREWALLGDQVESAEDGKNLALRKPQVLSAKAELKGAKGALEQARLNLERTKVKAPFRSLVLQTGAEEGQQVSPQTSVATLVDADTYWVKASLSMEDLAKLESFSKDQPIKAVIHDGNGGSRQGRFLRRLPELEPRGRMAQVLIEVDDPLAEREETGEKSPLVLGAYVSVELIAGALKGVFEAPSIALTDEESVWIVDKDEKIREVQVTVLSREEKTFIFSGPLSDNDRVVISPLAGPIDGMKVQTGGTPQPGAVDVGDQAAADGEQP